MIRLALAAAFFGMLFFFTPPADPHFRLCGFYWLTGHPCALCGLTRAMFSIAKGHFAEAIHFNALAPLGFALIFAALLGLRVSSRAWLAGFGAFAVYGVCRLFLNR